MSSEECLCSGEDVADNNGCAEGIDDVLVVGVEQQSIVDVACMGHDVPEKPITALISRCYCIKSYIFKLYWP